MKTFFKECTGCHREFTVTPADRDEDGFVEFPTEQCDVCEGEFCGRCFRAHDCAGHEAEVLFCASCDCEIEISTERNHRNLPALIDDDPFCAKCAYEKPWEKKAPAAPVVRPHFHEAV